MPLTVRGTGVVGGVMAALSELRHAVSPSLRSGKMDAALECAVLLCEAMWR